MPTVRIAQRSTTEGWSQRSHSVLTACLLSTSYDHHAILWRIDLETRPPEVVAAFVRCHAPYRLVDTRLESAPTDCRAP